MAGVQLPDEERGGVIEIVTSLMEDGIGKGRGEATLQLVLRLLVRRLGDLPGPTGIQARSLTQGRLEVLAESLLDFHDLRDLERWLSDHGRRS